ncbi:adenylate/guanylate cyclase domain-containing protein [uncultured Tateyamaria sp.]|uniref:adenylate/guanylate cyclase domain-containing protein n=1 Tax=uncultured Tateyamaria sp. TaxID=455651 RepID=UPI002610F82F|nr:adenylate/guanylate cyclase domain-containing protein [uncultured Tateyamaria sp.]
MQLQDISSRLIQSISVGICIVEAETGMIISQNDTFGTWFDTAVTGQVLDIGPAVAFGELPGRKPVEVRTKVKRRTLVIELSAHEALYNGTRLIVVEGQNISRLRETEALFDSYSDMVDRRTRALEREKTQVEKLLLNIMPRSVFEEYMTFGSVAPRLFESVSVLMLDFVVFTRMAAAGDPNVTVAELSDIFTAFDRISELHGCERIKTVGDCYMAARLQAQSEPMEITICASMRDSVLDEYDIGPVRVVPLRGFGETEMARTSEPGVNRRVA